MSDYDRYLGLIAGPFPFSHLGSTSFQMVFYALMVLIGIVGFYFSFSRKK